jgi:hypothetical protein
LTWNFELLGNSERGLFERQLQVVSEIGAALNTAAAASTAAEEVAEPKDVADNVAEIREDTRIETAGSGSPTDSGMAEPVVIGAFLGVAQNSVGFRSLLERLLGFFISRIAIGVILKRQLPIGALDFLVAGGTRNAKDLVVIPFSAQAY